MTDRSKSPRKRRLQLNAEDFAPPTDMHQAPDDPRLDDAWVQYYGGEKLGGIKKLTSIDDDSPDDGDVRDPAGSSERALISEAGRTSEAQSPPSISSVPHLETPPIKPQEDPPENRTHSTIAPIKDFRRQENLETDPSPPNPQCHRGRGRAIPCDSANG